MGFDKASVTVLKLNGWHQSKRPKRTVHVTISLEQGINDFISNVFRFRIVAPVNGSHKNN